MSSRNSSVYVHQSSSGPSSRSSSSSAGYAATSPRPTTTYREYDSRRASQGVKSGNNTVINHNKRHYDPNSPSPSYRS
ncbi:hypothetical protein ACHAQJ_010530 [Trichoderma viride]